MASLGQVPSVGDTVVLPHPAQDLSEELEEANAGRWLARVSIMEGRRLDKAILTPISSDDIGRYQS